MPEHPPGRGQERAADQLSRLLALVPYISQRPGVRIAELADEFAVSTEQITKDLNLLMVCGEPGYYPNELIDVVFDDEDGSVAIAYDAGMGHPVRLGPEEAVTLTAALRVLGDLPDLLDADAVHSALAKLEGAAAGAAPPVTIAPPESGPSMGAVRRALDEGSRVRMRYYTASRDAVTTRDVDPIRLLMVDGRAYLEGYCFLAEAVRRFRVDRIDEISVLEEPAQPTLWADDEVPHRIFTPDREAETVTLRLAPSAAWVAEYYLADEVHELADPPGALEVRLTAADQDWIVRLALSLGDAVRVVDRPDLAQAVRARARQALAAYEHPSTDGVDG